MEYILMRFGFNDKWRSYIIVCVFVRNLAV